MNLYFRLFLLILKGFFTRKADIFSICQTSFWVNPCDLDLNFHMNNGRYLTLMDLGRFDLMLKARIFYRLFSQGYYPVVASQSIRFRKALPNFKFFQMHTQIESWDEKDFYVSQKFFHHGQLYAEGYIKGRFKRRGQKESIPTAEIFSRSGIPFPATKISELAQAQKKIESLLAQC